MKLMKKVAMALTFMLVSSVCYPQTYKPMIKVSKGQEYNYLMDLNMEVVQSMAGQEMKYASSGTATVKNAISDVLADGKIDVVTSSWDAKINTKMMGQDSTKTFNGKVGSSTKFTLDKLGNVLSKAKSEEGKDENNIAGMDNMMGSPAFCEFPENTLKPGDKWSKTRNDSIVAGPVGKLGFNVNTNYTFVGKETVDGKNLAKITSISEVKISGKGNMQGMDLAIDGTGAVNGTTYIDPANGIVQTSQSNMELDINIAVSGQQSMTIPMTQKMTMNYKLIK